MSAHADASPNLHASDPSAPGCESSTIHGLSPRQGTQDDTIGSVKNSALFLQSAESYLTLLGRVGEDQWQQHGLGEWNVRSLAGHTARAILTVESYLGQDEPGDITIPSAEDYYNSVLEQFTDHPSIEARGVEAGSWLGDDPVAKVAEALARTKTLIAAQPDDRIVSIGGMGILLDEYLRTRVVELVVHSLDLAAAIDADDYTPPSAAVYTAVGLLSGTAVYKGFGPQVLRALTGRGPLPADFTVV
jgi:uncharacterized protein (TIGR03083 family)